MAFAKNSYRSRIFLLVVIGSLIWAACFGQEDSFEGGGSAVEGMREAATLRLAWLPGATFAGDYVASSNGYWEQEGLDVEIQPGGFEFDSIKLVASGADTFGVASGPQLLQARASGVPVVAIGSTIPRSPIGWVSKKSSGIKTPLDFPGHRIGAQFGTHTEITLEALCAKLKIPLSSFERIPVKFDPRPFVVGEIDVLPVYVIDQPVGLRRQGLELNVIEPSEYGVELAYGNLYFTREDVVESNPALVRGFLNGARRGWLMAYNEPEKAIGAIMEVAPDLERESLSAKLEETFKFIERSTDGFYEGVFPMEASKWEETSRILREFGELSSEIQLQEVFTNRFLVAMEKPEQGSR